MENNLDRFFRENLSERQFEFKNEYWLEAEKLLNAERRRRRALIFWWLGGAAVVVAVAIAVAVIGIKNQPSPPVGKPENQAIAGDEFNASKMEAKVSPGIEAPAALPKASLSGSERSNVGRVQNPAHVGTSGELAENESKQIGEPKLERQVETSHRQTIDLQALSLLKNGIKGDFSKKLEVAGGMKKQPDLPFQIGIVAGQIFQVQTDSGEQTTLGWHVGLALQRDFGKGWFAATGLNYLRRDGHFDASKSAERLNYRFGKEAETQILRPTSLHYLTLPLKLGWQRGRHVFEGGGGLHFLMGLRGEMGTLERVDNEKIFKPLQKGWLVEDGFKKLHFDASIGYSFRVNRQFSLGVSANYSFGGILKKNYVPPLLNGFVLREADRFFVSANAAYFIK